MKLRITLVNWRIKFFMKPCFVILTNLMKLLVFNRRRKCFVNIFQICAPKNTFNNRRKATQIKKLSTQKPTSSTYMSNPQKMPGYGGNCTEVNGCNPSETTYRYNNNKFATQGAVEASDRITRLKLDTIRGATNCPTGQTAQHTGTNCNGVYSTGNLQSSIRTNNWPKLSQTNFHYKNAQVKYNALFNENHDEVNYPQVSARARVRGATKPKRRTDGKIIENSSGVCSNSCGPQLLM